MRDAGVAPRVRRNDEPLRAVAALQRPSQMIERRLPPVASQYSTPCSGGEVAESSQRLGAGPERQRHVCWIHMTRRHELVLVFHRSQRLALRVDDERPPAATYFGEGVPLHVLGPELF